jgi:hypothetical protein
MDREKERRIRERAYEIWLREGQPQGRDVDHWEKAAAEIEAESGSPPESKPEREQEAAEAEAEAAEAETAPPRGRRSGAKSDRDTSEARRPSARRSPKRPASPDQ